VPAEHEHGPTTPSPTPETLRQGNDPLRDRVAHLERERDRLRRENERLRKELEAARRAGYRQAAPFSKGAPRATAKHPGSKAGPAHGQHVHRPVPTHVEEHYDAEVGRTCPHCHGAIGDLDVVSQYQEDLPPVRPLVREFRIEVHCVCCGRRVQGRHRLQTSDAVGAAAVQLGPQAVSLATVLHTQLGLPVARVARLFDEVSPHKSRRAGTSGRSIGWRASLNRPIRRWSPPCSRVPSWSRMKPVGERTVTRAGCGYSLRRPRRSIALRQAAASRMRRSCCQPPMLARSRTTDVLPIGTASTPATKASSASPARL
jgi:transposase